MSGRLVPRAIPSAGIPARLAELADEVRRLLPDWHRPERFYERRSEIAGRLAELAREERRRAGG